MIHSIKRHIAFFVLLVLAGTVPVLANPVKGGSNNKTETFVVDIQGKKTVPVISKAVGSKENHIYQLNLQPGEKVSFTLHSDKRLSLKVRTSAGVKEVSNEKSFQGVLSAPGDYVIEISTQEISLYTLKISGN